MTASRNPLRPASAATRVLPHGTRLGRYRVAQRLGVGGMAEVYLAVADGPHGWQKRVAIKLLHPHAASHADRIAELHREARIAATLEHPNIAQVLDVGDERGEVFLAMEYVHGKDLRDILVAHGRGVPLPLPCALTIVVEAARGLHYAHERRAPDGRPLQLVHRDVSPSNVLVSYAGAVKVADFGLVKVDTASVDTQTGVLKGKFGYMSPEQTRGHAVDRRSDVYALGIMLYELTLGRRAFTGLNAFEIMNKVLHGEFTSPRSIDPDYPIELHAIVLRAMGREPEDRFATAAELADAIEGFARDRGIVLGAAPLISLMEGLFGQPEDPKIEFDPEPVASETVLPETVEIEPATPPSMRGRIAGVAVAVAVVAGGLGWWLGAGRSQASTPAAPATAQQNEDAIGAARSEIEAPKAAAAEASPEPPRVDATADTATADTRAADTPVDTATADTPAASPTPRAADKSTRRKARRKGRGSRTSNDASSRDRDRDLNTMFPAPLQ